MDKITSHNNIVQKLVEEIGSITNPSFKGIETQVIIDNKKGHYILMSVGWHNRQWHYGSFVHIDVKPDGKVWIQHDGTDLSIAKELIKRGIPQQDIVLGFKSPIEREWVEGFAVA